MKLIPENHVQLFRDLLALTEKYNVSEFYGDEGGHCALTVDNINYIWDIEDNAIIVNFDFPSDKVKALAAKTFPETTFFLEKAKTYGLVSHWVSIKITSDNVEQFAHQSAVVGGKRETRTKELK